MNDIITIVGRVATEPTHIRTDSYVITDFRVATDRGYWNGAKKEWVDQGSNFYSISTYRSLAENVYGSIHKGEPVIVTGKLQVKEWVNGDRKGKDIEIVADAIGHNLSRGKSQFNPTRSPNSKEEADDSFPSAPDAEVEPADDPSGTSLPIPDEREEVATPF